MPWRYEQMQLEYPVNYDNNTQLYIFIIEKLIL